MLKVGLEKIFKIAAILQDLNLLDFFFWRYKNVLVLFQPFFFGKHINRNNKYLQINKLHKSPK